jgi:hypothetical protein
VSKFEFRNRTMKLDIAGNVFEIDASVGEDLAQQRDALVDAVKAYQAGEKTKEETVRVYADHINKTLGEKAFEKIFAKRKPDLLDSMGIMTFIANEIADFNRKSALTVVK